MTYNSKEVVVDLKWSILSQIVSIITQQDQENATTLLLCISCRSKIYGNRLTNFTVVLCNERMAYYPKSNM